MPGFIDQLEATKINVTSPDGSVHARYSPRAGTEVAFGSRGTKGHTEQSLAAEVTAALRGVTKGFARASRALTAPYAEQSEMDSKSPQARRRDLHRAAVAQIDVRVTSPSGLVKVRMGSSEGTEVRIRPGVLGRMDLNDERLAGEINAAVTQAYDEFGAERIMLHREYYSADSLRRAPNKFWVCGG